MVFIKIHLLEHYSVPAVRPVCSVLFLFYSSGWQRNGPVRFAEPPGTNTVTIITLPRLRISVMENKYRMDRRPFMLRIVCRTERKPFVPEIHPPRNIIIIYIYKYCSAIVYGDSAVVRSSPDDEFRPSPCRQWPASSRVEAPPGDGRRVVWTSVRSAHGRPGGARTNAEVAGHAPLSRHRYSGSADGVAGMPCVQYVRTPRFWVKRYEPACHTAR